MATEYLSKMTSMPVEEGTLDGFKVSNKENGLTISHLQFANDNLTPCATLENSLAFKKNFLFGSK